MRSKTVAAFVRIFASGLFCLGVAFILLIPTGCGSNGSIGGGTTTTVTSVTVSPASKTIMEGDSISFTAAVSGQDNPSQVVTWSVSPTSAGTITAGGVFASPSTITTPVTATVIAASTVPGFTNVTGSATVTINVATAQPPTVTLTASPSTITLGATTTLSWSSTNAASCTGSGAWSGTEVTSGSTTETPTAIGTATYTLACTGAAGSATASAAVTVTAAPLPDIDSISWNAINVDWSNLLVVGETFTGSNFVGTDTLYPTGFNNLHNYSIVSSSEITAELQFGATGYSPGWLTFAVCQNSNNTNCGISQSIAFLGAQNYLAASSTGELFFLDQNQGLPNGQNGYVRKYKADGTADGSFFVGALYHSIAVDNKTGNVLVDAFDYDENGGATVPQATKISSQAPIMAVAAKNGYGCFIQSANNSASCYSLIGGDIGAPVVTASNLGTTPWAIAMGVFGTETDAVVISAEGTPSLYKIRASDGKVEGSALPLPGITSVSTARGAGDVAGGLQVIVFDSGPASGTVAVLSTYDQLLLLVNASTWTVTQKVVLTGTPFRIAADITHGAVIVAYANPANVTTTYTSVNASSGATTQLLNTSSLLSVGLAISSDGTNIYSSQRNQIEVKQNK